MNMKPKLLAGILSAALGVTCFSGNVYATEIPQNTESEESIQVQTLASTVTPVIEGDTTISVDENESDIYSFTAAEAGMYIFYIDDEHDVEAGFNFDKDDIADGNYIGFTTDNLAYLELSQNEPIYFRIWSNEEGYESASVTITIAPFNLDLSDQDIVNLVEKKSMGTISLKSEKTIKATEAMDYYYSFTPSASTSYTIYVRTLRSSTSVLAVMDSDFQLVEEELVINEPLKISLKSGVKYYIGVMSYDSLYETNYDGSDEYILYIQKSSDTKYSVSGNTMTISGNGYAPVFGDDIDNEYEVHDVIIAEGITVIPSETFSGWGTLESAAFPASLKAVDCYAFQWSKLKEVTVAGDETVFYYGAFENCSDLTTMTFSGKQCLKNTDAFSGNVHNLTVYYPEDKGWDVSIIDITVNDEIKFEAIHTPLNGLCEVDGVMAVYKDDAVDTSAAGLYSNDSGTYCVTAGYVDTTINGIYKTGTDSWYVVNGKVQKSYSGKITIEDTVYTISSGKVTSSAKVGSMEADGVAYKITASSLNVRSGAGSSYTKLGSLTKGTEVRVYEIKNNWGRIDYKGKDGWISLTYCEKAAETTTPSVEEPTTPPAEDPVTPPAEEQGTAYKVTASSLSVRSGAGTSYTKIGSVSKGTKVNVLEVKNGWGRIDYNGKTGWISLSYCEKVTETTTPSVEEPTTPPTEEPVTPPAEEQGTTYTITASSLSVRSGAGTSYSKLGSLTKGTKVQILEVKNGWGRINYNGKTGWVSMSYCQKADASTTQPTQPTGTSYEVTASSLSVRSGAGTSYSKLGSLSKGTKVTVLETKNGWGRIKYNGKTGWISLSYCKKL